MKLWAEREKKKKIKIKAAGVDDAKARSSGEAEIRSSESYTDTIKFQNLFNLKIN